MNILSMGYLGAESNGWHFRSYNSFESVLGCVWIDGGE